MFICVLLVCFLLSSQVILSFDRGLPSTSTKTPANEPPRDNLTTGLPCQTLLFYLEIMCGVLLITVVAESSAILIIYFRRRRQNVSDKKVDSCKKKDNYEKYEDNSTDYETVPNDYKPIPPPLATLPRTRPVTPNVHPMRKMQRPVITGPHEGVPQSLERSPSQTLPLPVRRSRMPQAPRNPYLPPVPCVTTFSPVRPPIQFRLPPPPLHHQLLPESQSPTPCKSYLPASSPQLPPESSKLCNPKRPPAPLPKDIKAHADSIPKVARMPPRDSEYCDTEASDDEWTFENIYY